jgi:hypothetical protein
MYLWTAQAASSLVVPFDRVWTEQLEQIFLNSDGIFFFPESIIWDFTSSSSTKTLDEAKAIAAWSYHSFFLDTEIRNMNIYLHDPCTPSWCGTTRRSHLRTCNIQRKSESRSQIVHRTFWYCMRHSTPEEYGLLAHNAVNFGENLNISPQSSASKHKPSKNQWKQAPNSSILKI